MKDDKKAEIVRKTRKRVALFDIRIFELSKVCSFVVVFKRILITELEKDVVEEEVGNLGRKSVNGEVDWLYRELTAKR